jgi:signal transduction histidine kinase
MELGAMRHGQGFDEYEVMKEFEILGGVLFAFLTESARSMARTYSADEVFSCIGRVFHAMALVQQAAVSHYLRLMNGRVAEREERLRGFNRALTHEFRNRIGAAMGAAEILNLPNLNDEDRSRLTRVIAGNMDSMRVVLDNLLELTVVGVETRQQRHVRLPEAVQEAVRHLRAMAASRGVVIEIAPDVADVEVPAAAVELSLTNFISNAIKYADNTASHRWVRLASQVTTDESGAPSEVRVSVSDNGIGVPVDQRDRLFERLFRAANAEASGAEGTGIGLSIVRETMEALGGKVSAAFMEKGSVFSFVLPCRRASDLAGLSASRSSEYV